MAPLSKAAFNRRSAWVVEGVASGACDLDRLAAEERVEEAVRRVPGSQSRQTLHARLLWSRVGHREGQRSEHRQCDRHGRRAARRPSRRHHRGPPNARNARRGEAGASRRADGRSHRRLHRPSCLAAHARPPPVRPFEERCYGVGMMVQATRRQGLPRSSTVARIRTGRPARVASRSATKRPGV